MSNQTTLSLLSISNDRNITETLTHGDWLSFSGQIIAVIIAALLSIAGQKYFIEYQNKKIIVNEIHRTNEAVIYYAAWLESIFPIIADLVFSNYKEEQKNIKILEKELSSLLQKHGGTIRYTFQSIRAIEEPSNNDFISKLYNVGEQNTLMQSYMRMRSEIIQFNDITHERTDLIKNLIAKRELPDLETVYLRQNEVYDRTLKLLVSGEYILNNALFSHGV